MKKGDHISLFFKEVTTKEDAEVLRIIRNDCRKFMTRNTGRISKKDQKKWFKTAKEKYGLYLVYAIEYGAVITYAGYGVIHKNHTESLVTGGLLPEYRDMGLGKPLFKFLISQSKSRSLPVRLEVLKSNQRACKLYEGLGFKITEENKTIYIMELE